MAAAGSSRESDGLMGKYSNIDEYGFIRDKDFDFKSYENFISEYTTVLVRRKTRWNGLLNNGKKTKVKLDSKVKRFCRKGIPMEHRQMVWMNLSGAQKRLKKNPGLYDKLISENPSSTEDKELRSTIKTDIDRTFPDNIYFRGGEKAAVGKLPALERVLTAVGRYKKKIGYCQGMNYIVAMLLLVVDNEESAFWLSVALLEDILPEYYCDDMIGLRTDMEVLTELVNERNPTVSSILERESMNWLLLVSKWFICLYVDILPRETVLRIWDCLFAEGSSKILFRVAILLIQLRTEKVKQADDMSEVITAFRNLDKEDMALECHTFMQECFNEKLPLRRAHIEELRKIHEEKLRQEEAERLQKKSQNGNRNGSLDHPLAL